MFRFISVLQRKRRFAKDEKKSLALFHKYAAEIANLPFYRSSIKKLLLIRLDDIGDYLLFRNTLESYNTSDRWKGYEITLLGNKAWKDLFDKLDSATAHQTIWVDKKEYQNNDTYKRAIWQQLRNEGFDVTICTSATRPILLDDLCRLATGASLTIGFSNVTPHKQWKMISDKLYKQLFEPQKIVHEFFLNQQFANWCCQTDLRLQRPFIRSDMIGKGAYLLCFIGSSTKSRRWPRRRWMQFVKLIKRHYSLPVKVVGVLHQKEDALKIALHTKIESITDVNLIELVDMLSNAKVVVSNDTMAAHLGISCGVPVIIVSSGNNFTRFTSYEEAGIASVRAVYPKLVTKKRKQIGCEALHNHIVTTSDIASIKAKDVFNVIREFL